MPIGSHVRSFVLPSGTTVDLRSKDVPIIRPPLLGLGALYDAGFRIGHRTRPHLCHAAAHTLGTILSRLILVIGTGSLV